MAEDHPDPLARDLASMEFQRGVRSGFWRLVERVGDRLYIACSAWDGDEYVLELLCDNYGAEPCNGVFVDPTTKKCVTAAWPQGDNVFGGWFKWQPEHFFICWPGNRGAFAYHADWRALQHWKKTSNPLFQYLEFIRTCLNVPARGYRPRQTLPLAS